MQERAAGEPPKNDFLDLLLDYRGAEDGRGFDRRTLLSLLTVSCFLRCCIFGIFARYFDPIYGLTNSTSNFFRSS